jgi:hypothetical protein
VLNIFQAITEAPLELPPDVPIPPSLRDLLSQLLEKDPARRITVAGVLSHPWVTEEGQLQLTGGAPPFPAIEVSEAERRDAVDCGGAVSMVRARLKEKMFLAGEYLFQKVGDGDAVASAGWGLSCLGLVPLSNKHAGCTHHLKPRNTLS